MDINNLGNELKVLFGSNSSKASSAQVKDNKLFQTVDQKNADSVAFSTKNAANTSKAGTKTIVSEDGKTSTTTTTDDNGKTVKKKVVNGNTTIEYEYDKNGNLSKRTQLNPNGSTKNLIGTAQNSKTPDKITTTQTNKEQLIKDLKAMGFNDAQIEIYIKQVNFPQEEQRDCAQSTNSNDDDTPKTLQEKYNEAVQNYHEAQQAGIYSSESAAAIFQLRPYLE